MLVYNLYIVKTTLNSYRGPPSPHILHYLRIKKITEDRNTISGIFNIF